MASNESLAVNEPEVVTQPEQPAEEPTPEVNADSAEMASEPETIPESEAPEVVEVPEVSWQAAEYVHHEKSGLWYVALGAVILALLGVAILTKQWFSIPVFLVMAVAVVVYAKRQPRMLNYHIGEHGITVGEKFYAFKQFRSFAVIELDGVQSIDLDPTERFQPRLSLMFNEPDLDAIVDALAVELPIEQRNPDIIERFSRYIKF